VSRAISIDWSGGRVSGRLYGKSGRGFLLAHGAGTDQGHPRMVGLASALADRRFRVLTFNYPYTEAGRKGPDPTARLLDCHRAAADRAANLGGGPPILGGRSMGGRMSSYLAASGLECAALVLYAYPLHPAGRPDSLRADHLPDIGVPTLAFQGDRDALSNMDLFDRYLRPYATTVLMEGARHDLKLPGMSAAASDEWMATRTAEWTEATLEPATAG
jgi:predicted alpha/beta-hydrolase family hydrolase